MAEADKVKGSPAVYRSGQDIECWLTDMDGVLVHENQAVPGAAELIQRWVDTSKRFLVLTNNSIFTPRDLAARLRASGLEVPEENIWTSALATAQFLKDQVHGSGSGNRAYTIGEAGLTTALHEAGFHAGDDVSVHPVPDHGGGLGVGIDLVHSGPEHHGVRFAHDVRLAAGCLGDERRDGTCGGHGSVL